MTVIAIDPGSARCAIVAGSHDGATRIAAGYRFDVDATSTAALASTLLPIFGAFQAHAPTLVLLERGRPYVPKDATPQAASAMAQHFILQDRLCCGIVAACERMGVPVAETPRASWAPRLLLAAKLPGMPRGDAEVRRALAALLDADSLAHVTGVDCADAAGMLVAYHLPERQRAAKGPRGTKTEEQRARHAVSARKSARRKADAKRAEKGLPPAVRTGARLRRNASDDAFDALLAEREAKATG